MGLPHYMDVEYVVSFLLEDIYSHRTFRLILPYAPTLDNSKYNLRTSTSLYGKYGLFIVLRLH